MSFSFSISAPQNFDISECSDRSITVKWYMNDPADHQQYELNHRLQGSDNWNVTLFSLENLSPEDNGSSIYKLENLSPETCYELKICSVQNNIKSEYTNNKMQQTKQIGNVTCLIAFPEILIIVYAGLSCHPICVSL